MFSLVSVEWCVCYSAAGTELLRPRHRSLTSSSSSRLLSLAEAQARERSQSAVSHLFDVHSDPSTVPARHRSVFDYQPKRSFFVLLCSVVVSWLSGGSNGL